LQNRCYLILNVYAIVLKASVRKNILEICKDKFCFTSKSNQKFSLVKNCQIAFKMFPKNAIVRLENLLLIVVYLTSSCVNWAFFGMRPTSAKKGPIYTWTSWIQLFFLFYKPPKSSKSLKIFKISLTFCFDKLWHLSKSVHTGEISQILRVSNKKTLLLST
jgi:hypothetical protein